MWTSTGTVVVLLVALVTCCGDHAQLVAGLSTTFTFTSFPAESPSIVALLDAAHNSTSSTYDLNYGGVGSVSYCGRIVAADKVRMKDEATGTVISFSTSFIFSFMSDTNESVIYDDGCGEGMAFTFVASSDVVTDGERVQSICAYAYDPKPTDRAFAVKFGSTRLDAVVDPSDSTIGVMVNKNGSLLEIPQHSLCDGSNGTVYCSYFCGLQGQFSAWIDYDIGSKTLEVFFRSGDLVTGGKPLKPVITVPDLELGDVFDQEMYAAITAKTYYFAINPEVHRVHSWNFNSSNPSPMLPTPPESSSRESPKAEAKSKVGLIAGVAAGVAMAICITMGLYLYFCVVRKLGTGHGPDAVTSLSLSDPLSFRPFTFKELTTVTNNFADTELLASGAFGDVFKGTLASGTLVAVKRIKQQKGTASERFQAEANTLRQIRHRNLLQLRGWCKDKEGLFLVYDYMVNLSLDKWLHRGPDSTTVLAGFDSGLAWNVRRHVLSGVAAGLTHLHEEWVQCVLHRDIKSSNVLLDADFNAHLGDFGPTRLVDHEKMQKTTLMAGTLGYMAPELQYTGRATKETDVYAFGVLVLEVVCGSRPLQMQPGADPRDYVLLDRVWRAHEAGDIKIVVDLKLSSQLSRVYQWMAMVGRFLHVGLLCCLPDPSARPSMRVLNQWFQVMEAEQVVELPPLPATRPAPVAQFSMPPSSHDGTSSSGITEGSSAWQSTDKARA